MYVMTAQFKHLTIGATIVTGNHWNKKGVSLIAAPDAARGSLENEQFATLYREFLPRVLNYLRLRVGDEALAEELTASTFAQAFAKRHQLRQPGAFPGWLFRIARSQLAQHFRRRPEPALAYDFLTAWPAPGLSPEDALAQQQRTAALLQALRCLPPREQEILQLKFVAGLTNLQIAAACDLTPTNVGVIVFRALRKLRTLLDDQPVDKDTPL